MTTIGDEFAKAFLAAGKDLYADRKRREKDAARARRAEAARWAGNTEVTIKEAVFSVMRRAVAAATGSGAYAVSARTLYYQVRPLIQAYTDKPLEYGYFSQDLLTQYRDHYGPIAGLYYDPRGVLKEPHTDGELKLGTLEVASYQLPAWTFDKILYVEKKGLEPILGSARLADRYDMAVVYGEGYAVEACRELLAHAEGGDYTILVLHDADPSGYEIARTLGEETRRMPHHHIEVVDLGLSVADAVGLGLEPETFTRKKALPVQLTGRLDEAELGWFQGERVNWSRSWICRRVELNALTAPALVGYVEEQLEAHGATEKIVPPAEVRADAQGEQIKETVTALAAGWLAERLDLEAIVEALVELAGEPDGDSAEAVRHAQREDRSIWWKTAIQRRATGHVEGREQELRTRFDDLLQDAITGGAS